MTPCPRLMDEIFEVEMLGTEMNETEMNETEMNETEIRDDGPLLGRSRVKKSLALCPGESYVYE